MSYQVLARKWRPRSFREMVGQSHVLKALINALNSQRLHHAYLFTGTRGVGKTTIARIIAKCLNCEIGITSVPCGTCSMCREIDEGRFVDLIEIDAASRTKVEDTRELLDNVQYAPALGRFKVYLIDEVHMLSSHSFNALLKTLEEPPPYVKFILATTDPQKLPATILSRCLQFSLKNMTPERVVEHLSHVLSVENVPFEAGALWLLGHAADGSMRDAMSLTDQAIAFGDGKVLATDVRAMLGTLDHGQVFDLLQALIEGDARAMLAAVHHLAEQGPDWSSVLSEILTVFHRVAIAQALPESVDNGHGDRDRVLVLAQTLPAEDVQFYYQMGLIGRRDLPLAPDARGGFEMVLLRMLAFRPADMVDAPSKPLKSVGISQAAADSDQAVAVTVPASVIASPVAVALAEVIGPSPIVKAIPASVVAPESPAVPERDLPWNEPLIPSVEDGTVSKSIFDTMVSEPSELTSMSFLVYDSMASDQAHAVSSVTGREDEPLLNKDHIEPDMSSAAYGYIAELVSEHIAAPEPFPATGLALEWLNIFLKLPVSGMTASIGANCALIAVDGDNWLLYLDPAHSALFNETQHRRLNDALNQYYQRTLKVTIELVKPEQETPAQAASRLRAERQKMAEQLIYADPLVQQMNERFGASVRDDSIQLVNLVKVQV